MVVKEILKIEETNTDKIYLIKEGFFWRAYERSVYRFVKYVRKFQVIKKHIKKVGMDICYIGFPENMLEVILSLSPAQSEKLKITERSKEKVILSVIDKDDDNAQFENWKESIIISAPKDEKWFIQKIKEYPVFYKTPLETVQFVAELQTQITNN